MMGTNNYFWYAMALVWIGIILGLLCFATIGTGFILSGVVFWARVAAQILGVGSLIAGGIFFYWIDRKITDLGRNY